MRLRFLLICLCIPVLARSQGEEHSPAVGDVLAGDGLTLFHAAEYLALRPLHWETRDWLIAGGVGVGTGAASLADVELRELFDRNHTLTGDDVSNVVVIYGDGRYMFTLGAGMYIAGLLSHERWLRETGLLATGAMFFSGALSTAIKIGIGRARPFTGHGNHWFQPFRFFNDDVHSFPSGHTVVAFAMSTVLSRRIGNVWASIGLYTLATATAASRIYTSEHWFSDLVFGAATSIAVSNSLVSWFEGDRGENHCSLRVYPGVGGVSLVFTL